MDLVPYTKHGDEVVGTNIVRWTEIYLDLIQQYSHILPDCNAEKDAKVMAELRVGMQVKTSQWEKQNRELGTLMMMHDLPWE